MVEPLKETLGKVEGQLQQLEIKRGRGLRRTDRAGRRGQETTTSSCKTETASLVRALRAPQARGRWGELQLRRVVELAGHESIAATSTSRSPPPATTACCVPTWWYGWPAARTSSSTPRCRSPPTSRPHESLDERRRRDAPGRPRAAPAQARQRAGGQGVLDAVLARARVRRALRSRRGVPRPGARTRLHPARVRDEQEGAHRHAHDPRVDVADHRLHLAAGSAHGERHAVFDLGRELYDRLGTRRARSAKLGSSIESVAKDYNAAVGTLETRVLVTARRSTSSGGRRRPDPPALIESSVRPLARPSCSRPPRPTPRSAWSPTTRTRRTHGGHDRHLTASRRPGSARRTVGLRGFGTRRTTFCLCPRPVRPSHRLRRQSSPEPVRPGDPAGLIVITFVPDRLGRGARLHGRAVRRGSGCFPSVVAAGRLAAVLRSWRSAAGDLSWPP